MRILHISDFHLNQKTRREWQLQVKEALIRKLDDLKRNINFDIVAFTGDMIDKGGSDYTSAQEAFIDFQEIVIEPILQELNLDKNRFFLVPGNHDIERRKDNEWQEKGVSSHLTSIENINQFMDQNRNGFDGYKRMESFKKFEFDFYAGLLLDKHQGNFSSSFLLNINNRSVGITCFNSAWRCYDNNDHGKLILGDLEVSEQINYIKKTDIRIALVHHPLDSLIEIEKNIISGQLVKHYDMILFGHSHTNFTSMTSGFTGRVFFNMAPSGLNNIYSNDRDYSNGFSVLDIYENQICAEYWRYNQVSKEFILNTDAGQGNGRFCEPIPSKAVVKNQDNFKRIITNIVENHYNEIDNHLIGIKAENRKVTDIRDAFVMPPIDQGKRLQEDDTNDDEIMELSAIINSKWNQIFFGGSESGKTALLFRLVREFVESFNYVGKIPAYFDLDYLGNKTIVTAIKDYLFCQTDEVHELIKNNQLILLVDNLNYQRKDLISDRINKIERFVDENPEIRIIATSDDGYLGSQPAQFISYCKIPFKSFFIKRLKVRQIKNLMRQWIDTDDPLRVESKLEALISNFNSYSLPSTPMSVSLFLWSTEYSTTKPINHAVLLEMYVEIILQKLSSNNIYRENFDFTNKEQMLAAIAREMLVKDEDNYSLSYSDFMKSIEEYLKSVGHEFDAQVIASYFLERKIFIKHRDNRVRFSYSCFFHFFLAKRMEFDPDFYEHVIHENQYYNFITEIDYYTGLRRHDKKLLTLILERFNSEFESTDFVFSEMNGRWDKHFVLSRGTETQEFEPIARNMEIGRIQENRPSEKLLEDFQNRRLVKIQDPSIILKKNGNVNLELLLILLSNVLRNSEGVEDMQLKRDAYNSLIKYSLSWMVLYREYLIEFVIENNRLPSTFPTEISIKNAIINLPLHVQNGMNKHLGSAKLSKVISRKIESDFLGKSNTGSDLECFMSVALYTDINGSDFQRIFKKFIRKLKNTPVRDYAFFKLLDHYYRRTKSGSENEGFYLELLTELRIKSQKYPNQMKERIMNSFRKSKQAFIGSNKI